MQNQVSKYVGQGDDALQEMILIDHDQPMNLNPPQHRYNLD